MFEIIGTFWRQKTGGHRRALNLYFIYWVLVNLAGPYIHTAKYPFGKLSRCQAITIPFNIPAARCKHMSLCAALCFTLTQILTHIGARSPLSNASFQADS